MPDLAMCRNDDCIKKNECYRFCAIPSELQSYMHFANICRKDNNFKWFYEIDGKPIKKEEGG